MTDLKKYKKFIISGAALIVCAVVVIFTSVTTFGMVNADGYMLPKDSELVENLTSGIDNNLDLTEVSYSDDIYKNAGTYYVGEDRANVDISFPEIINGGNALAFYNEDSWLISNDLYPKTTFEGMFVSNGASYGADYELCDEDEFILIQLNSGLYITLQDTTFENALGMISIPMNSVMYLGYDALRYYENDDQSLLYGEETVVKEATITIGENSYDYQTLIKALGLVDDATKKLEEGKSGAEADIESAYEVGQDSYSRQTNKYSHGSTISILGDVTRTSSSDIDNNSDLESDTTSGKSSKRSDKGDSSTGNVDESEGEDEDDTKGEYDEEQADSGDVTENQSDKQAEGDSEGEESNKFYYRYIAPTISISNINMWSYATNGNLTIKDAGGNVVKGVTIVVYKNIKGTKKVTGTFEGHNVYSADDNIGRGTAARKTYKTSSEFTLSILEPNKTYYIQYTYQHDVFTGEYLYDEVTGDKIKAVTKRETYTSDFIEIKTQTLSQAGLKTVKSDFTVDFAAYNKAFQIQGLTLSNTSDYNSEDTSFDNFKLNSLPYVARMIFTLTPVGGGKQVKLVASSSVMSKARTLLGGTVYKSSSGLQSNTKYTATVLAYDKFGNQIPLIVNDVDAESYSFEVYTSKTEPTVTYEEIENISDSLSIRITVNDPDGALTSENGTKKSIKLVVSESDGVSTELIGTYLNGSNKGGAFNSVKDDLTGEDYLLLDNPSDGKTYELQFSSLNFNTLYSFNITGTYNTTPDSSTELTKEDVVRNIGSTKIYTASLTKGSMAMSTTMSTLLDRSATLSLSYTSKSTTELYPMIDIIRIKISESDGKDIVCEKDILMSDFDVCYQDSEYYNKYDSKIGGIVLVDGGATSPTITLVTTLELLNSTYIDRNEQKTIWDTLFPEEIVDSETGSITYTKTSQLLISMPDGTLISSTEYDVSIQNIVKKGKHEQTITTTYPTSSFTTKKIQPKILLDDFFVVGTKAEFVNIRIYDPNHTIEDVNSDYVDPGYVTVKLYYGTQLVSVKELYATDDENATGTTLDFDEIIPDGNYTVELIAIGYNDTQSFAGRVVNNVIKTYEFTGAQFLYGELELVDMTYSSLQTSKNSYMTISAESMNAQIDSKTYELYEIPEDATFIEIEGVNTNINTRKTGEVSYYKADKTKIKVNDSYSDDLTQYYTDFILKIPSDAKYFSIDCAKLDEGTELSISYFTVSNTNFFDREENSSYLNAKYSVNSSGSLISSNNYRALKQVPVNEGQTFVFSGTNINIATYDKDKNFLFYVTSSNGLTYTIPSNVKYISISYYVYGNNYSSYPLYGVYELYSGVTTETNKYTATLNVNAKSVPLTYNDASSTRTYFDNSTTKAYLNVYSSTSYRNEDYGTTVIKTIPVTFTKDDANHTYVCDTDYLVDSLDPNKAYKVDLVIEYLGRTAVVDSIVLQTNYYDNYIRCENDLNKISRNPYGNYIVLNDFEVTKYWNLSLYGTVDFNGHKITYKNRIDRMFAYIYETGTVKNVAIDHYEESPIYFVLYNYGLLDNVVVHTYNEINSLNCIICGNNYGTISNFIFSFDQDIFVDFTNSTRTVLIYSYGGTTENGYIYSNNNAGVIYYKDESVVLDTDACMISLRYDWTTCSNVFSYFDSWYYSESAVASACIGSYGRIIDCYHVGEFYKYSDAKSLEKLTKDMGFRVSNDTMSASNLYVISENEYTQRYSLVSHASINSLHDVQFQKDRLGDSSAFVIDRYVKLDFFPRLVLSDSMAKYQEYIDLPSSSTDVVPEIISDEWGTGSFSYHTDDSGYIMLRFNNPAGCLITDITFDGLSVVEVNGEKIVSQSVSDNDGMYEVVVYVEVDANNPKYLSAYSVASFSYSNRGAVGSETSFTYITKNIEFFKTVSNAKEWNEINDNMDWNYRLTNDIDFNSSNQAFITINGKKTDFTTTKSFTGKIYGDNHTISNIVFTSTSYPYVIYTASSSTIKDLIIQNIQITSNLTQAITSAGFIRYSSNSTIDNVHIIGVTSKVGDEVTVSKYSKIEAAGRVGMLVGSGTRTLYQNCSVSDTKVNATTVSYEGYYGGMIGYSESESNDLLLNSYCRNVQIDSSKGTAVTATGIMIGGYNQYAYLTIENCYVAKSTLNSTSGINGGIVGGGSSWGIRIRRCFVDATLTTKSDTGSIGGLTFSDSRLQNCFVNGNIISSSDACHRVGIAKTNYRNIYAYSKQIVNDITGLDGTDGLLTGQDLVKEYVWSDIINIGDQFSYKYLSDGYYPILYSTYGDILYGQEEDLVELPGQGVQLDINVVDASTFETPPEGSYNYNIQLSISHATISSENFIKDAKITIEGLDISDTAILNKQASVSLTAANENETTNVLIGTNNLVNAFDKYKLTVTYGKVSSQVIINFGSPIYWEIKDIKTWNELMAAHGTTGENFKITGNVDFGTVSGDTVNQGSTSLYNLDINRLEGSADSDGNILYSISNLYYDAGDDGEPWIAMVSGTVSNIKFYNITCDYSSSNIVYNQAGLISKAGIANNVKFDTIVYYVNNNTAKNSGCIGITTGLCYNIYGENIDIIVKSTSSQSNLGGLIGYIYKTVRVIEGNDITISAGKNSDGTYKSAKATYAGCLVGYSASASGASIYNSKISNSVVNISGNGGAAFGSVDCTYYIDVSYCTVKASSAGGACYHARQCHDTNVSNCTITGSSQAAGVGVSLNSGFSYRLVVYKCDITAPTAGGVMCYSFGANYMKVIECNITGTGTRAAGIHTSGAYQYYPVIQNTVIRKTNIILNTASEGIVGGLIAEYLGNQCTINNCYIAEDVNITLNGKGIIGGLIGSTDSSYRISNCAVGATITQNLADGADSKTHGVGGFIGRITFERNTSEATRYITNSYCTSKISGSDYVSAVIGYSVGDMKFTTDNISGVLFTGTLSSNALDGTHISTWVNSEAVGSYGDVGIYIWEDSTINDELIIAKSNSLDALEKINNLIPESSGFATSTEITTKSFYKKIWGSDCDSNTNWYLSNLETTDNTYFPFPYDTVSKGKLKYTNTQYDETTKAGITFPFATAKTEITVYRSSINTINIESSTPEVTVQFGTGATNTYTIGTDGGKVFGEDTDTMYVLTLTYLFQNDVIINGETFTADSLRSEVSAYGYLDTNYWYFIDSGYLYYGDLKGLGGIYQNTDLTTAKIDINNYQGIDYTIVNLVDNKILLSNGVVREVLADTVGGTATSKAEGTICGTEPFYSYDTIGGSNQVVTVDVYGNFSMLGEVKVNYRVFIVNGEFVSVSSSQSKYVDSIVLTYRSGANSKVYRYFTILDNDNNLKSFYSKLSFPNTSSKGYNIKQISNDFMHTGYYVIIKYLDGHIEVINYYEGTSIYSNLIPQVSSLGQYVKGSLIKAKNALFVDSPDVDYSYEDSENLLSAINSTVTGDSTDDKLSYACTYLYVDGEGLYYKGKLVEGNTKYESGVGAYIDEELVAKEVTEGNLYTSYDKVKQVTKSEYEELMTSCLGDYTVCYDDNTGEYEIVETNSVTGGNSLNNVTEELTNMANELVSEGKISSDSFVINRNISKSLTPEEKMGNALIYALVILSVISLTMIYFLVIRKKKEKNNN